jgi:hypothetical protein
MKIKDLFPSNTKKYYFYRGVSLDSFYKFHFDKSPCDKSTSPKPNKYLTNRNNNASYTFKNQELGKGVYFTKDYDTAKLYGCAQGQTRNAFNDFIVLIKFDFKYLKDYEIFGVPNNKQLNKNKKYLDKLNEEHYFLYNEDENPINQIKMTQKAFDEFIVPVVVSYDIINTNYGCN